MKKIFSILALILISTTAYTVTDYLLKSPSGNLLLESQNGYTVKLNDSLRVDRTTGFVGINKSPTNALDIAGNLVTTGNISSTSGTINGDGTGLTALNGSNITSGTISVDRLPVSTITDQILPAGIMMPYAGTSAPSGWVFAYGQEVSQVGTYARLYAAIGSTYCTTDHGGTCSSGYFRIPDLRGRNAAGKDNMGGIAANRITTASTIDGSALGKAGGDQTQTSNVSIANHIFTQPSAHVITQPVFTFNKNVLNTNQTAHGHFIPFTTQSSQLIMTDQVQSNNAGTPNPVPNHKINYVNITAGDSSNVATIWTTADSFASWTSTTVTTTRGTDVALSNNHSGGSVDSHDVTNNAVNNLAPTVITNYIIKI